MLGNKDEEIVLGGKLETLGWSERVM